VENTVDADPLYQAEVDQRLDGAPAGTADTGQVVVGDGGALSLLDFD